MLQCFPEKEELLRNMMGLLGNVAEVKTLRHRLMTSEFIQVFTDLLESSSDGIEVCLHVFFSLCFDIAIKVDNIFFRFNLSIFYIVVSLVVT